MEIILYDCLNLQGRKWGNMKNQYEIDCQQGYDKANDEWLERINKIRAEIETKYGQCDICEYFEDYDYEENDISEYRPIGNIADILQIIDKYKADRSVEDGNDDWIN